MGVSPFTPRPDIPIIGSTPPAEIQGMTIVVVVECKQCDAKEVLALVNAQPAVCPACGATVSMDALNWRRDNPVPKIALSATRPIPRGQ